MKKTLFVLPLCALLANCSSQKKTTTPPAGPGISNVNISANGSAPTPVNTSATSSTNRDWAYKSKYDTTLNGTWALAGIMGSAGTWTSMQDSSTAAANAMGSQSGMSGTATGTMDASGTASTTTGTSGTTDMTGTTGNMTGDNATATTNKSGSGKTKTKNSRAVYDSAKVRLSLDPTSLPSTIDSSLLQPYKYWGRTPTMTINATRHIFSGNTGCNSMSGSFNFSGNDIQFSRSINTSKMQCNDYDEANFLATLKKVDNYAINGDQLELKQGSTLLLTFKRRA
jgi:hypothetical protein